ncbi:MAG: DUF3870 domain-containing protein [Tissierella sp.]|nr:DUF3870 domain-containing protein [Tissierella sp.]
MVYSDQSVYFSASSKLPSSIPSGEVYDSLNIGFVIDKSTGVIEDVSVTLLSAGATRFLMYLIIGFNLHDGDPEELINEIKTRYFGGSQKAIIVATRLVIQKYKSYMDSIGANKNEGD